MKGSSGPATHHAASLTVRFMGLHSSVALAAARTFLCVRVYFYARQFASWFEGVDKKCVFDERWIVYYAMATPEKDDVRRSVVVRLLPMPTTVPFWHLVILALVGG